MAHKLRYKQAHNLYETACAVKQDWQFWNILGFTDQVGGGTAVEERTRLQVETHHIS